MTLALACVLGSCGWDALMLTYRHVLILLCAELKFHLQMIPMLALFLFSVCFVLVLFFCGCDSWHPVFGALAPTLLCLHTVVKHLCTVDLLKESFQLYVVALSKHYECISLIRPGMKIHSDTNRFGLHAASFPISALIRLPLFALCTVNGSI